MSEYFADISWSTLANNVQLSNQPYRYIFTVNPLDPNEPGAGNMQMSVGDWFIDFSGYPFLIENINGTTITVYDINERGNGNTSAYGPYNGQIGYIYRPKYNAFLLTQAQLRKLDKSAPDVIQNMEKIVLWKYRGVKLEDGTNVLDNTTEIVLENLELTDLNTEGWQGGKKVKIKALSSGGNSYLEVTQTNHGFDNDFVYYDGTTWYKAVANDQNKCATHFAVKIDNDTFNAYVTGDLEVSFTDDAGNTLVNGQYYFLSQTVPGKVTINKPSSGIIQSVCQKLFGNKVSISIQEPYMYEGGSGGSGGSPGGEYGQLQFNDAGSFGGVPFYYDRTLNSFSTTEYPDGSAFINIIEPVDFEYFSNPIFKVGALEVWRDFIKTSYILSKDYYITVEINNNFPYQYDTCFVTNSRIFSIAGGSLCNYNDNKNASRFTYGFYGVQGNPNGIFINNNFIETYLVKQDNFAQNNYVYFKKKLVASNDELEDEINYKYLINQVPGSGFTENLKIVNGMIKIFIYDTNVTDRYINTYEIIESYRDDNGNQRTQPVLLFIPKREEFSGISLVCENVYRNNEYYYKIKVINNSATTINIVGIIYFYNSVIGTIAE